jgi:transposase InsO family protein
MAESHRLQPMASYRVMLCSTSSYVIVRHHESQRTSRVIENQLEASRVRFSRSLGRGPPIPRCGSEAGNTPSIPSAYIKEVQDDSPAILPDNTSIDWTRPWPSVYTAPLLSAPTADKPFIFDSGATCHISPERSDFLMFRPMSSRPVLGLGGSAVYATECGSVELLMSDGQRLTLHEVLFIPSSDVRLISVHALNAAGSYVSHFDMHSCWVTDCSDKIVARRHVLLGRNLYIFPSSSPRISRSVSGSHSAHLARRVPTVASWHLRLGHLHQAAIVEMAHAKVVQGMPINLSTSPPKCDPCIIGKQTRSSVPKIREGLQATCPLERIFLDLCGPMSFTSRSGNLYSMNIIDDFSSYVWSIPLRTKREALIALQNWHTKIENQSNFRLTYIVTDNGELSSTAMHSFCSQRGIIHLFTAPYTSAHNGKAERLHRTIHEKSRTMRLACGAPPSMWDEFCATAAFLTNLSPCSSLDRHTPYEFWFNRIPSLSHLREIGCRAYALIVTDAWGHDSLADLYRCL